MSRALAIDLGTANTLVYVRGRGIQLRQPTVMALDESTGEILALGDDAYAMIGRTPSHIVSVRPLRGGAISDFETTSRMIRMLIHRACRGRVSKPRVIVCVPSAITQVERKAVRDATLAAGARVAYLIEEPMAAALGVGLPLHEPSGNLIVDVGGGTTEVACISLGGTVASKSLRVAGFDFDAAIMHYLRREYAITIGERTAESVKIAIGSAVPVPGEQDKFEVRGRELATGLPKTVALGAGEVREALEEPVSQVVQAVLDTLSESPPELANDVIDKGIFLTGGSGMLRGLAERIAQAAEVSVHRVDTPLESVALGAGRVIESFDDLGPLFVDSQANL
jgi:rod shape-determining protein MreB and related proteins